MNILFVNNIPFHPAAGGIERVTDVLARSLKSKGYCVYYLSGPSKNNINYDFPVPVYILPERDFFKNRINLLYLEDLTNKLNIDVIINQRGTSSFMDGLFELKSKAKIISVIHSVIDSDVKIKIPNYSDFNIISFKDIVKVFFKIFLYPFFMYKRRILENFIISHYDCVLKKSNAVVLLSYKFKKDLIRYTSIHNRTKIKAIPNPNSFFTSKIDLKKKKKQILYVGRLSSNEKKPIRLLMVWNKLYKKYPDWKVIFVGEGDALSSMRNYISKNNIKRVEFVGAKSNVESYYRESDIICLTSDFEGWGMALTEGMTFGCIPICFDSYASASDIIDDGINGFLISPFDIEEYSQKLSSLICNDKIRAEMALAAHEKSDSFSIERIVSDWEELFMSI